MPDTRQRSRFVWEIYSLSGLDDSVLEAFFLNDFADLVCHDTAASQGIFYADEAAFDGGLHRASFKAQIRIHHFTILQHQIFAIAKRLGADDFAADKMEVFGIPAKVFPLDDAVFHPDVLAVPEGVFCLQMRMADDGIGAILERIFGSHGELFKEYMAAVQEWIFGRQIAVLHGEPPAIPAKFRGMDIGIGNDGIITFPDGLGAAQRAFVNLNTLIVPKGSPAGVRHAAVDHGRIRHMPEGIAQVKIAVFNMQMMGFFQGGFTVCRAVK